MNTYIATFYSQYGAVQFRRFAKGKQIECKLAPVPRVLSSSCGTCAHYKSDTWDIGFTMNDLETIYERREESYLIVYSREEKEQ